MKQSQFLFLQMLKKPFLGSILLSQGWVRKSKPVVQRNLIILPRNANAMDKNGGMIKKAKKIELNSRRNHLSVEKFWNLPQKSGEADKSLLDAETLPPPGKLLSCFSNIKDFLGNDV